MSTPESPDSSFALHQAMVQTSSLEETLSLIATVVCRAVGACETSGVTLTASGGPRTVAHHGEQATALDDAQYADDLGPCLTAARENTVVYAARISDHSDEWPAFARRADELGIRSSLSLPLTVDQAPLGALNLYASPEAAFDDEVQEFAVVFAREAALAAHNAAAYWEARSLVTNLQRALDSRDLIGQAKGVLAAVLHITPDEAFQRLRATSQRSNVKLRDVAEQVVLTGELPGESQAGPSTVA